MSQPTRQLFGTDGIRGVAGEFPLTPESVYVIGRALGHDLLRAAAKPRVLMGQDTRQSSAWIADRVALGLASVGVQVESAGVITTPGVAYLARAHAFAAGVVVSASHNPWTDNGIKVFSGDGYKLPDAREMAIEQEIFSLLQNLPPEVEPQPMPPSLPGASQLREAYIRWLAGNVSTSLSRYRILVDCAHGAATAEAPELFRACGIPATFVHAAPDGKNINEACGALHPEALARLVAEQPGRFDLGVTFDGDADRALFCDGEGRIVNGDAVMLLAGRDMQARGALAGNTIVATTMSNMGLEVALRRSGISLIRANVGDKYVLETMQKTGATLGGEQSGHILFRDGDATTGDGLLTALRVLDIMARTDRPLADLVRDLKVFPQTIQNVRVREKLPLTQVPEIQRAIEKAEQELDGNGRVVVRYSGTEALARVMVEAESEERMRALAEDIASAIRTCLGA
ncbi:MAG TPA: phosphoglucosamine mutase [Terriglobales bacterium]|nr:phosphoglucosamine mutase [Terriglobales bacterium]